MTLVFTVRLSVFSGEKSEWAVFALRSPGCFGPFEGDLIALDIAVG